MKYKGNTYKTGYKVDLWKDGKSKTFLVARLVAFTFLKQNIDDLSLTVNHIDGNRLSNLEIISLKENIQHGFRTGLYHISKKIKIIDKVTGTLIYPSSLSEGSKLIGFSQGYLSEKIKNNEWQNERYSWEILKEGA